MPGRHTAPAFAALAALGLAPATEPAITPNPIEVVVTEGTNMAAALSPDETTLALDLLGRIWTLPASGGSATPLTDPFGDARAPTWSPDGERIAFQAYWAGDYDIWVVGVDGSDLEQVTWGPFDDREPHWSPDGTRVVFSSDRAGTYDIWEVDVATRAVTQITVGPENEYNPAYGPDGNRIAYVTDGDEAGVWTKVGAEAAERIVDLDGGEGFAPSWAPDGSQIAYNRLTYGTSELYVAESVRADDLGLLLSSASEDVFPFRASWREDGALLYTADGKIRLRAAAGAPPTDIELTATVTLDRPTYRKALRSFEPDGPHPVRGIVSPALSPDGSRVAFAALGDLWLMEIGSEPMRLTDDPWVELDPTWSPDGSRLAYASDRDGQTEVWVRDVASGTERKVTEGGGRMPSWSPDGTEIAFSGGQGPGAGVRVVTLSSGGVRTVRTGLNDPGRATWSPDGRSIAVSALWTYSSRFREGVNRALLLPADRVVSDDDAPPQGAATGETARAGDVLEPVPTVLQSSERWLDFGAHVSVGSRSTDGPIWSPNGRLVTYVASGVLWVRSVSPQGDPLGPATRLNNEQSSDPSWAGDSRSILYLTTDRLRRVWLESGRIEDVSLPLEWERNVPVGRTVVHAGALFDGVSESLRRDVDIVIEGHRIVRVADHASSLHGGRVVDASEGVVSPGLIEMHMHGGLGAGEAVGRQWLAYGITSVRTPASDPFETVEGRESYATFRRIGPRFFGSGNTIDGSRIYYAGAPALTSSGQVELSIAQSADLRLDILKTYVRLPDAVQRRVIEDAHALGIPVSSHELYPGVAYGADGVEHVRGTSRRGYSTKVTQLNRSYQDVVELLVRSRMTITPTVGIYGGYQLVGQEDESLFDDPRVPVFIGERARRGGGPGGGGRDLEVRRRMVSDMASLARRVVQGGGVVVMGTDSPINPQGLSLIVEMQALVDYGGMRPVDVMRATTSVSADAMGYGAELGAVRPGMLADLVVFGSDPLTDIRAVRDVRTVVRDGRVYAFDELLSRPGS
jgi:Tol biopolymer transport system component/imidazolonepropionase-like amidohydrolase